MQEQGGVFAFKSLAVNKTVKQKGENLPLQALPLLSSVLFGGILQAVLLSASPATLRPPTVRSTRCSSLSSRGIIQSVLNTLKRV